ncbi:hypothetical protein L484_016178 [Morus notabilis]|uniref:Uncharacterized protein n=1 Tax=Morus notabilis TaxID=981085 RepID=W9S691_9ROSA|nr:hypothetical protein L484_016178 [Morus notabilis]
MTEGKGVSDVKGSALRGERVKTAISGQSGSNPVSTGRPVTEQCNTTGRPVVCTPVDRIGRPVSLQSGQLHRSTGFHVIRSTAQVDRWNQLHERSSQKSVQNLQIQSQIEIFQRETTRSGF